MLAYSQGVYDWIKLFHILAAIAWVGARWAGQERGADDPEVQRRVQRIFTISRYDLAVLLLVVVDMVVKPGCSRCQPSAYRMNRRGDHAITIDVAAPLLEQAFRDAA